MIELCDVSKTYYLGGQETIVADRVSIQFPKGRSVGLLGRNGAGKSSLLRMIAGTMDPTSGEIIRHGTVSWPVGFAGSFHGDLSGAQNVRFVARIYGCDGDALTAYVAEFSGLGDRFYLPVRAYSSGMRSRLAFGLSMGMRFDTYLVDEVTSVGDGAFREKSEAVLKDRLRDSGAIVVSHTLKLLARICQSGAVLEDGSLYWHDDIMDAIDHHRDLMGISDG